MAVELKYITQLAVEDLNIDELADRHKAQYDKILLKVGKEKLSHGETEYLGFFHYINSADFDPKNLNDRLQEVVKAAQRDFEFGLAYDRDDKIALDQVLDKLKTQKEEADKKYSSGLEEHEDALGLKKGEKKNVSEAAERGVNPSLESRERFLQSRSPLTRSASDSNLSGSERGPGLLSSASMGEIPDGSTFPSRRGSIPVPAPVPAPAPAPKKTVSDKDFVSTIASESKANSTSFKHEIESYATSHSSDNPEYGPIAKFLMWLVFGDDATKNAGAGAAFDSTNHNLNKEIFDGLSKMLEEKGVDKDKFLKDVSDSHKDSKSRVGSMRDAGVIPPKPFQDKVSEASNITELRALGAEAGVKGMTLRRKNVSKSLGFDARDNISFRDEALEIDGLQKRSQGLQNQVSHEISALNSDIVRHINERRNFSQLQESALNLGPIARGTFRRISKFSPGQQEVADKILNQIKNDPQSEIKFDSDDKEKLFGLSSDQNEKLQELLRKRQGDDGNGGKLKDKTNIKEKYDKYVEFQTNIVKAKIIQKHYLNDYRESKKNHDGYDKDEKALKSALSQQDSSMLSKTRLGTTSAAGWMQSAVNASRPMRGHYSSEISKLSPDNIEEKGLETKLTPQGFMKACSDALESLISDDTSGKTLNEDKFKRNAKALMSNSKMNSKEFDKFLTDNGVNNDYARDCGNLMQAVLREQVAALGVIDDGSGNKKLGFKSGVDMPITDSIDSMAEKYGSLEKKYKKYHDQTAVVAEKNSEADENGHHRELVDKDFYGLKRSSVALSHSAVQLGKSLAQLAEDATFVSGAGVVGAAVGGVAAVATGGYAAASAAKSGATATAKGASWTAGQTKDVFTGGKDKQERSDRVAQDVQKIMDELGGSISSGDSTKSTASTASTASTVTVDLNRPSNKVR